MSYSTNISKQNEDSNLVSSLMAAEQRPMDSNEERSRASPQNLELETNLRPSKKYSHPGCISGSHSAPAISSPTARPYSFTPPFTPTDSNSTR